MAKKYKRSMSQSQVSVSTAPDSGKPVSAFSRRNAPLEFNPDYGYVLSDLKRIGIMSVTFIFLLVVLHFTLPSILQLFQH
jgi:hypothetical protein